MLTTLQLLDLAKQRLALARELPLPMTDYRLAKLLDIKLGTLSSWRTGRSHIGAEFAQKFAEACELPEAYVYACIEHERTKDAAVRNILESIAKAFSTAAAAAILSLSMLANPLASKPIQADPLTKDSTFTLVTNMT